MRHAAVNNGLRQRQNTMRFRTEITFEKGLFSLRPEKPLILTGSCFADNMSARMRSAMWDASNPLGVLFNPLSIARVLDVVLFSDRPDDEFIGSTFESDGVIHSWLFDSSFSAPDIDSALAKFRAAGSKVRAALRESETLAVTFGTAYCYLLADSESADPATHRVVSNCHKQPQKMFTRRRVAIDEIAEIWTRTAERLRDMYPNIHIIFTVSPVRHVRDGLHENNLSKATLLMAIDSICAGLDFCHYFPAFEAVNDDLRDYRFYARDLVHPSEEAVEYIWELLQESCLDDDGRRFIREGSGIFRRMHHRPVIDIPGDASVRFKAETERLYNDFTNRYPHCLRL